ncbi:hypothetical protein LLH00_13720 [bacterium]|nr:hypothetical protein [bacterium]
MLVSGSGSGRLKKIFLRYPDPLYRGKNLLRAGFFLLAVFSPQAVALAGPSGPASPLDTALYEPALKQATALMLNMKLDSAEVLVERWTRAHPGRPAGPFFRSALLSWRLFLLPEEDDDTALKRAFEEANDQCRARAERVMSQRGGELEGTSYLGAVYGQQALLALIDRRWLAMAPLAKKAWQYVQRTVALDPQYYDSYMGLGIYLYFTDILPRLVRVLAEVYGFEGDRARGLASLELAAQRGYYSQDAAGIMLLNIYSETEPPDSSIVALAHSLAQRYPDNPLIQWRLGDILLRHKDYAEAETVFRAVLERVDSGTPFYRNRMFTRWSMLYRIGICRGKLERREEALAAFEEIVSAGQIKPEWLPSAANFIAGGLYLQAGDTLRARERLQTVRRLPDFEGSRDRAAELLHKLDK